MGGILYELYKIDFKNITYFRRDINGKGDLFSNFARKEDL